MLVARWTETLRETSMRRLEALTNRPDDRDPLPEKLGDALIRALEQQDCDSALLSCAAASHCGADPSAGLIPAVSALMLEAALASHLPVLGLVGGNRLLLDFDEATALLAGDALIPLALENLCGSGGLERHSALIVSDAVRAMGTIGALARLSLEVEEDDAAALKRIREADGEMPLTVRECVARFASVAGARCAAASPDDLEDMAKLGLEIGRAAGMASLTGRICGLFGIRHGDLAAEARALLDSASSRLSPDPPDALARLLVARAADLMREPDLLSSGSLPGGV